MEKEEIDETCLSKWNPHIMTREDVVERMARLHFRSYIFRWLFVHNKFVLTSLVGSLCLGAVLFLFIALDWLLFFDMAWLDDLYVKEIIVGVMMFCFVNTLLMFRINYLRGEWNNSWWTIDDHQAIQLEISLIKKEKADQGLCFGDDYLIACPHFSMPCGGGLYWLLIQITEDNHLWYRDCVVNDLAKK